MKYHVIFYESGMQFHLDADNTEQAKSLSLAKAIAIIAEDAQTATVRQED